MTPRKRVLGLLGHSGIDRVPCFSGMGNVTAEVHKNAQDMAALAASTYQQNHPLNKFYSDFVDSLLGKRKIRGDMKPPKE